ncbi:helix-turn-helix domain-containing protein [Bacillus thuringiensis]|uniref:helix-turn-helix transcriptional regulator n=1 Tax=Bacillus cereus group TaxID=86661 RepID=UPI0012989867|nr:MULTISPECIES: helix-turn-helix transcriptional regulator [unclassified Bacillus cereus group]MEB8713170.1 helix-turn-helix transcriptional regulator [Bacillus cereus]MRB06082.1 helix-turn-helix domain-containing protein [Bacillus thuringiensis]MEB9435601.1 helix-turn-helix transcriptional regulator [Bacillus cereus]MEB9482470.1 helix-turn-helix transcriptional regulator [Bacillus cereus]MRC50149.1 helix-turn-helix domain-containing protein [Bacillus thuringiensis]
MRERIINERKERKLTQKDLAEALSVSEVFVRKIEKGDSNPSRKTMKKYQIFFGIKATELFPDIFEEFNDTKYI